MPFDPDAAVLAALLPGTWRIGATNFPVWLRGDRLRPRFRYDLKSADPLIFHDVVTYTTGEGAQKSIEGIDRFRTDGFVWRGTGLFSVVTSRWSVAGASEDSNILVIRFAKSVLAPAGVDVVVREGTDSHAFRTAVAGNSDALGLTHGEFASLSWLELAD
ncbi:MAG: hypothetical protein V4531_00085 [Actinomycetota bacterium]